MPKTILVADDNDDLRSILAFQLKSQGYRIVEATDGIVVHDLCLQEKPDLILMDVQMPGMDGAQASADLKEDPRTKHIPVIFLTSLVREEEVSSFPEDEDRPKADRMTFPKTVTVDVLSKRIEEVLQIKK